MFNKDIKILAGPKKIIKKIDQPFNKISIEFLNELSKNILTNNKAKKYPDLITFAFWARKKKYFKFIKKLFKERDKIRSWNYFSYYPIKYASKFYL